ncbi:MAG: hypothetical protein JWN74_2907 [Acidobacteriaceae bacterium]|nr:hypothetical protein [Acidobacteriaceae bacterium]
MRSLLSVVIIVTIASAELAAEMPTQSSGTIPVTEMTSTRLLQTTLSPLLRDSARIFSGTVVKVEHRNSDSSSALPTTSIRFRVDEAIRNVRRGQIVELEEWGGLWQSGERYRPGERVLLFLYPPSKLGLTSPVGHSSGRFPVNNAGHVLLRSGFSSRAEPIAMRRVVAAIRQAERK